MDKPKRRILIITGLLAIATVIFFVYPLELALKNRHKTVIGDLNIFSCLFKDSVRIEKLWGTDTLYASLGSVRESDQYYIYKLENGITAHVLVFKDLENVAIDSIKFNFNSDNEVFLMHGVGVLNEDVDEYPIIAMKYKIKFGNSLSANFDSFSEPRILKREQDVIAFFGRINNLFLGDGNGKNYIKIDLSRNQNSLIVFYCVESKFYVIMFTSNDLLKETALNLLDLK
jgi:hypothetical protein